MALFWHQASGFGMIKGKWRNRWWKKTVAGCSLQVAARPPRGIGALSGSFLCFGGEQLAALGDEGLLLRRGQGEGGKDFRRELGEGEVVGGTELAVPLGCGEGVPVEGGDPVDAGEVGCGNKAFALEEVIVAGRSDGVGDERMGLAAAGCGSTKLPK